MSSRQNREARKEYPTGHNKGNDSPDRSVPTFGAPVTIPPVSDDTSFRDSLLATTDEGGTPSEHIDTHISVSQSEARRRAEDEAASRVDIPDDSDGDMTVFDAARDIRKDKQDTEAADR